MTVERLQPSGGWLISDMVNGYRVQQRYYGYSKKEAEAKFRLYLLEMKEER